MILSCPAPFGWVAVAGRNENDEAGYVHRYNCRQQSVNGRTDDRDAQIEIYGVIGWSRRPVEPGWTGGELTGYLVPLGTDFKLVSTTPLGGLEPLAKPDPSELPNNHLAYAGQWFFFALTALVIYFLALRRRWRDGDAKRK